MNLATESTPLRQTLGWSLYLAVLLILAGLLPLTHFDPRHAQFILIIGAVGMWRYSLGIVHFLRAMWFSWVQFPRDRRKARALGDEGLPSHVYLLITSFRIEPTTTAKVYRAAFREALRCGAPATIVASIVEMGDEHLIRALWEKVDPQGRLRLKIVRIPGTGKRDGLAHGFRAISRDMPPPDAVAAVIDGDTVLDEGVIRKSAPYFKLFPNVGALTTNEFCSVEGSALMREWHRLRFAQRHLNMCSMALSHRVLTLTGRMSMFRASIITSPEFIHDVQHDALDHWRLGHFKFLTGDDKSSWFSLMRQGHDTYYVPDASINTVEHPPDSSFLRSSLKLMFRWYGNSLRQNSRATSLGISQLGGFCWYVLWDQRISMWTSLFGLFVSVVGAMYYGAAIFVGYLLWIGLTRLVLTLLLRLTGHRVGPAFPALLYYSQIVGSLVKIYVFNRLDRQSWTRQDTSLKRDLGVLRAEFNRWSSRAMTFSAASCFGALIFFVV